MLFIYYEDFNDAVFFNESIKNKLIKISSN
jgi:hypothetical protein